MIYPYAVLRLGHLTEWLWRNKENRREDVLYFQHQHAKVSEEDEKPDPDRDIHYCATLTQAQTIAKTLANQNTSNEYLVVQCMFVYAGVISKVNIAKFEPEKGLLPV